MAANVGNAPVRGGSDIRPPDTRPPLSMSGGNPRRPTSPPAYPSAPALVARSVEDVARSTSTFDPTPSDNNKTRSIPGTTSSPFGDDSDLCILSDLANAKLDEVFMANAQRSPPQPITGGWRIFTDICNALTGNK